MDIPDSVTMRLKESLPAPCALHEPNFRGSEWDYVKDCIDSGWVSSAGKYVDHFENLIQTFAGCRRAVATSCGTSALHVSLLLAGVRPGDEVLVPALTFVATANAVVHCGAVPHFVDSDPVSLGMDPGKLHEHLHGLGEEREGVLYNRVSGRPIRALVPVHLFGWPCRMTEIMDLANTYSLSVVEDAAEALGSFYKGRHLGTFGVAGALSFNGNKLLTTGGGGAVLANSQESGEEAKALTTTAKIPHKWRFDHDRVAYNYRLPNLNAALGLAQLERVRETLECKKRIFARYQEIFADLDGVSIFESPLSDDVNHWINLLILEKPSRSNLESILEHTTDSGIMTRPLWTLMTELLPFRKSPRSDLSGAQRLVEQVVCLPSSEFLFH